MKITKSQKIISIILICLIIVLLGLIYLSSIVIEENAENVSVELASSQPETLSSILARYDVEYIERNSNKIYVKFNFQLYNEDGSSNEKKLNNLLNELMNFFQSTFYLIDEENDINITVFYSETGNTVVTINNKTNFFEVTDGKTYYDINNVKIVPSKNIYTTNDILSYLKVGSMRYSEIIEQLGEPIGIDENGYYLFDDGNIKVSKYESSNMVRNIVYSEKYLNQFVSKISDNYSIDKVYQEYGNPSFGGLNEGFLGYRNSDFYLFFYNDEISVYGYSYFSNIEFEKIIKQYLIDLDIEKLSSRTRALWSGYYKYELDVENGYLYLCYPSKGVEIEITDKTSKGIKFYSNYYFSDDLLEQIKNGEYTLNADEDLIYIAEQERVKN